MTDLTKLNVLPVNKTVVFYSPIEGKDVLVRTGTVMEGSCFFHALLHAYSKDYVSMNSNARTTFVKRLRTSILKKDKKKWENLSNGLIAKVPFQENVNTILTDFYKHIKSGGIGGTKIVRKIVKNIVKDENDVEIYKLITEMIPLEKGFLETILPSAYEKCNENNISECKKYIVKYSVNYYIEEFNNLTEQLEEENIKYYLKKLEYLIQNVVEESENNAYNEYIESLADTSIDVDSYTIELISEKINRDIYFIDANTRMPYKNYCLDFRKRKSIILMWTGGCHYEIVGRLLPDKRIQREFDFKDPLIKRIHTYLCNPEKIQKEYPNLVPYLSKDIKKKLQYEVSDSDEDYHTDGSKNNQEYISSEDEKENSSSEQSEFEDEPIRESVRKNKKNNVKNDSSKYSSEHISNTDLHDEE